MDAAHALIDWTPLLRLLGLAAVIALLPLSWCGCASAVPRCHASWRR